MIKPLKENSLLTMPTGQSLLPQAALPQKMGDLDRSNSSNSHCSLRFDDCHPVKMARMTQIKQAARQRFERIHHEFAQREELMEELHSILRTRKRTSLERNLGRQELLDDIREAALYRMDLAQEQNARRRNLLQHIKEAANVRHDRFRSQSQKRRMIYFGLLRHFARRNKNTAVMRHLDGNGKGLTFQLKQHTRFYYRRQLTPKSEEERKAHMLAVRKESVRRQMHLMVQNLRHKRLLLELTHKVNRRNQTTAREEQSVTVTFVKSKTLITNKESQPNKTIRSRPTSFRYQRKRSHLTQQSSFSAMAA